MSQITIEQAMQIAIDHHQSGRLAEAEQLYRQILAQQPDHAHALHYLGLIAARAGQFETAVNLIRRAVALKPNDADAHCDLGIAMHGNGQIDASIAPFRRAIAVKPNFPEANFNLGNSLLLTGQLEAAIGAYRQAISLRSNYVEAYTNLGNALRIHGQLDQAIVICRRAIAFNPNYAEAYGNLGVALIDKGQLDDAIIACRRAIALKPDYVQPYTNLTAALVGSGQHDEAITVARRAIALRPDSVESQLNLAGALIAAGQYEEAIAAARQAITLRPEYPEAYFNIGIASFHAARLNDSISAYKQAIALAPNSASTHSPLAYALHFHPAYDAQAIAAEHRRWNERHAEPFKNFIQPHTNNRNPDRRLRIGYVSPDFRNHVVGRNILPLFQRHNHQQFEIVCYAQLTAPDAITTQLQQCADQWRNIAALSDDQVARQIREDRIDILVDLSLHMAGNRLSVFARKPAPIQITFAGYPGSTGLSAIDYRLSDPYLDPVGMDESIYSEHTLRLPDTFWCYDPLNDGDIEVNELPARHAGLVTFGCLNNFSKINEAVLTLWAKALRGVEGSRLLLLGRACHRQMAIDCLGREGINADRVEFAPPQSRRSYLQLHHRIDIGLDSFPYNGHTTSLESFWMGVPVVTLVGERAVSRAGSSQLSNLGLTELAAQTPEEFVSIAVALAEDQMRLGELRSTLRRRMEQSSLMDGARFTGNIETAYRQVWRTWCR